jgi:hypothetical protein
MTPKLVMSREPIRNRTGYKPRYSVTVTGRSIVTRRPTAGTFATALHYTGVLTGDEIQMKVKYDGGEAVRPEALETRGYDFRRTAFV